MNHQWVNLMLHQLGNLPKPDLDYARSYLETLLRTHVGTILKAPPNVTTAAEGTVRERILTIFCFADPNIKNTPNYATVEKMVNGLLLTLTHPNVVR